MAQLKAAGSEVAMEVARAESRFCYVDTRAKIGCMLEVVDPAPSSYVMLGLVAKAAAEWDGRTDPIRPYPIAEARALSERPEV